ncbi:MAG: hypothetical protein ACP5OA_00235 [Candidatus Woesearchaeota archaeon]
MGVTGVLLEELVKHTDILMDVSVADAVIISERCKHIGWNEYEIRCNIKVKRNYINTQVQIADNNTVQTAEYTEQHKVAETKTNETLPIKNNTIVQAEKYKRTETRTEDILPIENDVFAQIEQDKVTRVENHIYKRLTQKKDKRDATLQKLKDINVPSQIKKNINPAIQTTKKLQADQISKRKIIVLNKQGVRQELHAVEDSSEEIIEEENESLKEEMSNLIRGYNSNHPECTKTKPTKFKCSGTFLPSEKEILSDTLSYGIKMFNTKGTLTISNNAIFPENLVKLCLGEGYDNVKKGDTLEIFKILYNMNSKFSNGILLSTENHDIITNITKYSDYSVMRFLDYFWNKENITLECVDTDKFKIVYDKKKPLLENRVVILNFQANEEFYIGLSFVAEEKSMFKELIEKEHKTKKSYEDKRRIKDRQYKKY